MRTPVSLKEERTMHLNTRSARVRATDGRPPARRGARVLDALDGHEHDRQRSLVEASLLLSRREDVPTSRRWA
jgi:hypothetical protein